MKLILIRGTCIDKKRRTKRKTATRYFTIGLKLFACKGYEATKINDIAEETGMSLGLLYHYFELVEILHEELINIALVGRTGKYFTQSLRK